MNINVTYRQLKSFILAARLGNFTRAAEQMHITQAGLSIMMRELESQLDTRLFDRTTRFVTLTAAGEQFLPVAKRVVADLEESASQLGAFNAQARSTLRVGVTPLVSTSILPQACEHFRRLRPDVTLKIVDADPMRVQHLVEMGELDCGLGAFFKNGTGIQLTPLFEYELMWITPGASAIDSERSQNKKGGKHVNMANANPQEMRTMPWSEIGSTPLLSLPAENKIQQAIETRLETIGRAHEDRQTFRSFETLIAMVAAGMGAAVVPSYARVACARYGVRTAILTEPTTPLKFYRLTKRGSSEPPAMGDFTDAFVASVPL